MADVFQRQARLSEQIADGVQREETHMTAIENTAFAVLPAAAQKTPQHVKVLHVRDAGHNHAPVGQHDGRLAQHAPRIEQMLQHVGEDNGVERMQREGKTVRLDIGGFDAIEPAPRPLGPFVYQFDAGDVMAARTQQPAEFAAGATDFKHAAALGRHQRRHFGTRLLVVESRPAAGLHRRSRAKRLHP
ncbi:MAG TPA: hypothetical protein VH682_18570 [Gemmataceae bacterium]|jgi:hypothetical protein